MIEVLQNILEVLEAKHAEIEKDNKEEKQSLSKNIIVIETMIELLSKNREDIYSSTSAKNLEKAIDIVCDTMGEKGASIKEELIQRISGIIFVLKQKAANPNSTIYSLQPDQLEDIETL